MSLAESNPVCFVSTADRDRARQFYGGTLCLAGEREDDFALVYDLAGGGVLRITTLPDFAPSPHPVLGWNVADIVATVRALAAGGVTFSIYEGMGQDADGIWTAPDGSAKVAFFADPDGNVLSLTGH
jgi:catechol 2,3-dioxygenase-like lactoylglutathione lyase family enzyme